MSVLCVNLNIILHICHVELQYINKAYKYISNIYKAAPV